MTNPITYTQATISAAKVAGLSPVFVGTDLGLNTNAPGVGRKWS